MERITEGMSMTPEVRQTSVPVQVLSLNSYLSLVRIETHTEPQLLHL